MSTDNAKNLTPGAAEYLKTHGAISQSYRGTLGARLGNEAYQVVPPFEGRSQNKGDFHISFEIELDCWLYGVSNYPGEMHKGLIHSVLREMLILWQDAISSCYPFSITEVAHKFSKAAKYVIGEQEIAFCILALLPHPTQLSEEQQFTLGMIIDQVENSYGGAIERMEKRWKVVKPTATRNAA